LEKIGRAKEANMQGEEGRKGDAKSGS